MTETPDSLIGVDVGGTHIDAVLLDGAGRLHVHKVRSTPSAPEEGFMVALDRLVERAESSPEEIAAVVHGTTVATNALVMDDLARVGLLTTSGFRDVLEIGTQQRAHIYDPWKPRRPPIVPRELRFEASERIGPDGELITPLDRAAVERAAVAMRGKVDAVAVVFLFSFMEDGHEREAADILAARLPGVPITISSRVSPEFREYPRTSTTVLNAALLPVAGRYIDALSRKLGENDYEAPLQLMRSNGGVVSAGAAAALPVGLIASGPAAGVVGGANLIRAAGIEDAVTLDIGGTTADVSLILGGQPQRRFQGDVDGVPVSLPQIDVLSIGAGGGSIARVDSYGALSVGPESAGADPGPAAYGRGGELPTVTDAHLVLGNLDPSRFLGGELPIDPEAARVAVRTGVAEPLGIGLEDAAAAIIRMADVKMANALRVTTVSRGQDPRRCALVAFGGAGPMHACAIAEELGIERILVPRFPGLTSALGLIMSDARYDFARTHIAPTAAVDVDDLRERIAAMEAEAFAMLDEAGTRDAGRLSLELDMRYRGQAYQLTVPVTGAALNRMAIETVERDFHVAHERIYGHAWPGNPTEIVTLRLTVRTPRTPPDWEALLSGVEERRPATSRLVWTGGESREYAVHDRRGIEPGLTGPLLIEQDDSTIVVHAGWRVEGAGAASLLLERVDRDTE